MKTQMKNKAVNALIEMGMPANIKGFRYIAEAMELFAEDESWMTGRMQALYEKLAQAHDDTPSRVERAVRHAFGIVLEQGPLNTVEKYLTLQHMTNGNLLATLYLRLSQEE